jgi:hypothetical protein
MRGRCLAHACTAIIQFLYIIKFEGILKKIIIVCCSVKCLPSVHTLLQKTLQEKAVKDECRGRNHFARSRACGTTKRTVNVLQTMATEAEGHIVYLH